MSKKKLYKYNGKFLNAKQIAAMKYPKAPLVTVQRLLREGLSVQEVLDRNLLHNQQTSLRKAQKKSRKLNQAFTISP